MTGLQRGGSIINRKNGQKWGCWRWFFCLHWKLKNLPHLVGIEKGSLTTFILKINRKLTKQDALNKKQPPLTPGKSEWRLQYQIFDSENQMLAKISVSVATNASSCSFVRFAHPFGCFPARRSFLFSYRRSMRASMLSVVYSSPFWLSTRTHLARHMLASP